MVLGDLGEKGQGIRDKAKGTGDKGRRLLASCTLIQIWTFPRGSIALDSQVFNNTVEGMKAKK